MANIFWGDTSNVILKVKDEIGKEELETLKELHPNAIIISKDRNISLKKLLDEINLGEKRYDMDKVYYVEATGINYSIDYDNGTETDEIDIFIYKDSVFTSKDEAYEFLRLAENNIKEYNDVYDVVDFEVCSFYLNPVFGKIK